MVTCTYTVACTVFKEHALLLKVHFYNIALHFGTAGVTEVLYMHLKTYIPLVKTVELNDFCLLFQSSESMRLLYVSVLLYYLVLGFLPPTGMSVCCYK